MTQQAFADLVGISRRAVCDLAGRGILPPDASGRAWLAAYCAHLSAMGEERGGAHVAELVAERARLAREQADRIAMRNAAMRRELAPTELLDRVLIASGERAAALLGQIPVEIGRRHPEIGRDALAAVAGIVGTVCGLVVAMRMTDADEIDEDAEPSES